MILLLLCGAVGIIFCEINPAPKKQYIAVGVMTIAMCLMALLKSETVGVDFNWIYRDIFSNVAANDFGYIFAAENPYRSEPVFGIISWFIALFTDSPLAIAGVFSAIIILLRVAFITKYVSNPWLGVFCYIGLGFFSYSLCTLRQEMAISIAMFALPFLMQKKPLPYFAITITATLCHNSLAIMLPLYIAAYLPLNKVMIALYTLSFGFILIFSEPLITWFTATFPRFGFYSPTSSGAYFLRPRNLNTVFLWLILLALLAILYKRIIERNPRNIVLFNIYIYAAVLMAMVTKHFVFQRVALVLLPVAVMLIPEAVESLRPAPELVALLKESPKGKNNPNILRTKKTVSDANRTCYSVMGLFMFVILLEYLFLLYANRLDLVPYTFFWM